VAKVIQKKSFRPAKVTAMVGAMLDNAEFAHNASAVAHALSREDGVKAACDALESLRLRTRALSKR